MRALFIDIGGVVLTNGWDHVARAKACATFALDPKEIDTRHALMFDTYELGRISLKAYLDKVVFYTERSFTQEQFIEFMFAQSQIYQDTFDMLVEFKERHGVQVVALSNEGRELTEYRIKKFNLSRLYDFYVSSCFAGLKKPDPAIYRLALDMAQVSPDEVVYIEDRALFAEIGQSLDFHVIKHVDADSTKKLLYFGRINDF